MGGLVAAVRRALAAGHSDLSVVLCDDFLMHARGAGDAGWGCGYKNVQNIISSLQLSGRRHLFGGAVPAIPAVQRAIDDAHRDGFDTVGARQLGVPMKKRRWIGPTDCAAMLTHRGVDVALYDFVYEGRGVPRYPTLAAFVWKYYHERGRLVTPTVSAMFSGARRRGVAPPLMLQHEGHSRSIIGAARRRDGAMLVLVCDPDVSGGAQKLVDGVTGSAAQLRRLLVPLSGLRKDKYQVLAVRSGAELSAAARRAQREPEDIATRVDQKD